MLQYVSTSSSPNDFNVFSKSNKHYRIKVVAANLYNRKETVADHHVFPANEKTLLKLPAVYRHTEVLPGVFLASIRKWSQEENSKEHIWEERLLQISHI